MSLSWRIVSGSKDLDVTGKVRGTPQLTWNALGGCEIARVRIDLPLSAFPDLNEQARLIVTDPQGRGVWDGYCTDPGGVDDDNGEAFDLIATGSMVLASDRFEPLVYRDELLASWTRTAAGAEAGQAATYDDPTLGTGWLVAHPQGYPIATGARVGIEYRALEHAAQSIGAVTFTVAAGAVDAGFVLRVTTYSDDVLVDTIDYALATGPVTRTLIAGVDIATGLDVVAINLVRVGGATNVTTGLSFVRLTGLAVAGSRVDRFGAPAPATAPLTSRVVVEDLIGRGMLAQVDPHRAVVEDSAALHTQLAFPEGTRGAGVITALRQVDPDMVWMYGARGPGGTTDNPAGHDFTWTGWSATEVRYDLTDADAVSRPGGDEGRCHRISVFYRESETGPLKREVVQVADPGGGRLRDADPINLGISTSSAAVEAGQDALDRLARTASAGTATVARLILDRRTGMDVEPWEIRPGALARVQATGELLRVTEVACDTGAAGASATLTLGDPAQTLEDRLLAFLRGEADPTTPPITLPPPTTPAPPTSTPDGTDGEPPASSPTLTWRPGFGSVFLSWTPVANADQVIYRILIGTSPSLVESPSTLAGRATGDFFIARTLPNGTGFINGVTYYARAIAEDADGSAPAGPVVSGTVIAKITKTEISDGAVDTPQLNANAVNADYLIANNAWIDVLRATNFYGETITGPVIRTAASNPRIELNGTTNTFRAFNASGVQTFSINGSTGAVEMLGTLKAGSDISAVNISGSQVSGGTIAGTIFRTVSTAGRGFQLVNYGIYGSDESGNTRVIIETLASTLGRISVGGWVAAETGFRVDNGVGSATGVRVTPTFASLPTTSVNGDLAATGTVTGQNLFANGQTGASAAPAEFTGAGRIQRASSTRRKKSNIATYSPDVAAFLSLEAKTFTRNDDGPGGRTYVGFIAEDLADAGMEELIYRDAEDLPAGIYYAELSTVLQVVAQNHEARLSALEAAA